MHRVNEISSTGFIMIIANNTVNGEAMATPVRHGGEHAGTAHVKRASDETKHNNFEKYKEDCAPKCTC
jgi:hypothetical protein